MKLPKGTRLTIRQALEKTHSASERERLLTRTQTLYNAFIQEAPAPGGLNLLRSQYYGGLSVFAFYESMDRKVEMDVLQEILWRMLLGGGDIHIRRPIRFPFSGTWLQKLTYAVLGKYASFANKRGGQRTMEKHLEIRSQSGEPRKRDQYAADELPGRGLCEKARVRTPDAIVLRFGFQSGGAIWDASDPGPYGSGGLSRLRFLVSDGKRRGTVIP